LAAGGAAAGVAAGGAAAGGAAAGGVAAGGVAVAAVAAVVAIVMCHKYNVISKLYRFMFSDRESTYIPDPGPSSFSGFSTFSSTVGGAQRVLER